MLLLLSTLIRIHCVIVLLALVTNNARKKKENESDAAKCTEGAMQASDEKK